MTGIKWNNLYTCTFVFAESSWCGRHIYMYNMHILINAHQLIFLYLMHTMHLAITNFLLSTNLFVDQINLILV